MRGILIDNENDLAISIKRDANGEIASGVIISDTEMQDAFMVLSLNQGDLKEDPIAGVNLTSLIRGKLDKERIRATIKIGFQRCGIDLDMIKDRMRIKGIEL